ncbi:MAG: hypothetical protein HS119_00700 [Flavobacteriales bacterium]|nr:hypothetical protein [Flavobacteriales bacterium]MCL4857704.1 hypothetical protein [Flavobacteriales bacterium]
MKILLPFLFLLFGFSSLYSQTNTNKEAVITSKENTSISSTLTYHPEIPAANTYKVIKNTTGQPISSKILEQINLHRRYDVDYLWKVDNTIEILIYFFNKPTTIEPTVD